MDRRGRLVVLGVGVLTLALHAAAWTGQWMPGADSARFLYMAWHAWTSGSVSTGEGIEAGVMPGYAWMLAGLNAMWPAEASPRAVFERMVTLGLLANGAALVVWLMAWHGVLRRAIEVRSAWVVVGLLAVSSLAGRLATEVLPDLWFAAAVGVWLLGLEVARERRVAGWSLVVVGAAGMVALRTPALVMFAAWGAALLWEHRRRIPAGIWIGGGAAVAAVIGAVVMLAPDSSFGTDVRYFWEALVIGGPPRWGTNASGLFGEHLAEAVIGQDFDAVSNAVVGIASVVAAALLFPRRPVWAVVVLACVAQWLVFLSTTRYVLPIVPLLYAGLWIGAERLSGRWRGLGWVPAAVIVLLAAGHAVHFVDEILERRGRTELGAAAVFAEYETEVAELPRRP